jgi:non-specific serine/threonine protein kinase
LSLHRQLGHRRGVGSSLNDLGVVAIATGDLDEAGARLHESLTIRAEQGDRRGIADSLAALAKLALAEDRPRRAARLLSAATALRQSVGLALWPVERHHHLREVAAIWQALSDRAFVEAWEDGQAIGVDAAIAAALTQDEPSERPVPAIAAPAVGSGPEPCPFREGSPLTPREHEVAALVAQGYTNRQIAEVLVIAERTAENHVARICAKLEVHSRSQVAAWVAAREALDAGPPATACLVQGGRR